MTPQPPVRDRILESATRMFDTASLRSVSADKVIADAGTTKVTFYRHFPTKDDLVVAYLDAHFARVRAAVEEKVGQKVEEKYQRSHAAGALLEWLAETNGAAACRPGFRGCVFINAAAEYPASGHPVRATVERYRSWFHGVVAGLLRELGVEAPGAVADQLIMLRDGAMVHGFMDDPQAVTGSLVTAGRAIVRANLPTTEGQQRHL